MVSGMRYDSEREADGSLGPVATVRTWLLSRADEVDDTAEECETLISKVTYSREGNKIEEIKYRGGLTASKSVYSYDQGVLVKRSDFGPNDALLRAVVYIASADGRQVEELLSMRMAS